MTLDPFVARYRAINIGELAEIRDRAGSLSGPARAALEQVVAERAAELDAATRQADTEQTQARAKAQAAETRADRRDRILLRAMWIVAPAAVLASVLTNPAGAAQSIVGALTQAVLLAGVAWAVLALLRRRRR